MDIDLVSFELGYLPRKDVETSKLIRFGEKGQNGRDGTMKRITSPIANT